MLPDATALRLEACEVDDTTAQITLRVQSTQTSAPCPLCATPARRIHSDYGRTLADLPWAQYRVCLQLRVRKWFCRNRRCCRRIFTERLPPIATPWARRTLRLAQRLLALGVALGGKAGVRLGHAWDVAISRNGVPGRVGRTPPVYRSALYSLFLPPFGLGSVTLFDHAPLCASPSQKPACGMTAQASS